MTTHLGRAWRALLGIALMASLFTTTSGMGIADAQTTGFPSVGTSFNSAGPYAVSTLNGSQHTYWYPTNVRSSGLRHPVILWGNGTGASPTSYDGLLRHFASHGFIVAAANTPNAGSGTEMLAGLSNLTTMNNQSTSPFFQAVDTTRVASTGHSQGGVGALAASRDARVMTTFPIEGAFSASGVTVPTLFLAGQNDTIARPSQIKSTYSSSTAPAAYAEIAGATHFTPAGNGGYFRAVGVAWARWHLMDDANARGWFVGSNCGLCNHAQLSDYEVNARFVAAYGNGGPGEPPPGECVRASTRAHVSADRAVSIFSRVYARGSGDSLGSLSYFNYVSLRQSAPNYWSLVSSC
jgi:hypothetical protein